MSNVLKLAFGPVSVTVSVRLNIKTFVMLASVEGIYHHGQVELREQPVSVPDETPVIVTFLGPGGVDLRARGIAEVQAAELRARLSSFAEDWESSEMAAYDHYDAAKSRL